jgi:hypothetical protein
VFIVCAGFLALMVVGDFIVQELDLNVGEIVFGVSINGAAGLFPDCNVHELVFGVSINGVAGLIPDYNVRELAFEDFFNGAAMVAEFFIVKL